MLKKRTIATGLAATRRVGSRAFVLDIPFELRLVAARMGCRWDPAIGAYCWCGIALPEDLAPFAALPFSREWHLQARINGGHDAIPVPAENWQPREHQADGARLIAEAQKSGYCGFLLADDVGCGKTLTAWTFARRTGGRALIVTTAGAVAHWRNTLLHAGADADSWIINYDRLGKLFELPAAGLSSRRAKGKRKRIAREGQAPAFDLVLWDEAHKCRSLTSARAAMMRKINARAKFCVWISATAGQNPLDLAYLAPLLAQRSGERVTVKTTDDFARWCVAQDLGVERGPYGKWLWDGRDDAIGRLHTLLFGGPKPAAVRRLPTDIAGWPALERQLVPQTLDAAARQAYAGAWNDFKKDQMGLAGKRGRARHENAMVARLRFRQKSSWLRIPATVAQIVDALANHVQVAVSVAFIDTAVEIRRRLEESGVVVAGIYGGAGSNAEAERLRFQKGEANVVVFTVEDAISLHQGEHNDVPRVLLIHDLRWSAIAQVQVEGRTHRDGRFAPAHWLYAPDTVEERIAAVLAERARAMKQLHGDDAQDLRLIEAEIERLARGG